jgi:hypothetical protein
LAAAQKEYRQDNFKTRSSVKGGPKLGHAAE